MKKTRKSSQRNKRGYALLITVVFIGVALMLLGGVMNWTNSASKQTLRNNLYTSASAAAEAADETVLAYVMRDFTYQSHNSVASYRTRLPSQNGWPVAYSFSDKWNNTPNQTYMEFVGNSYGTNWPAGVYQALGQQYQGLNAYVIIGLVSSTASALNQPYTVPATVSERFKLAAIPLCQFAIFYNMDLEICPGGNMTINGPTYVNGTIWADPEKTLLFDGAVNTTEPQVMYTRNPNDPQPSKKNPDVVYAVTNSPFTNSAEMVLPVGTNSYQVGASNNAASVAAILDLPPTGTDPNSPAGKQYLYNQADLVLRSSSSGDITAYFQDPSGANRLEPIANNLTNVTSTPVYNSGGKITGYTYSTNLAYTFATNASFYDYREGKTVQAVQLNVGALKSWLNGDGSTLNTTLYNDAGHYIDSVYVYNGATPDSSDLPAVRVANGSVLPSSGLTVVTPLPLYVLGNYNATGSALGSTNTSSALPAALMGDAITVLSTAWKDSYNAKTALGQRNASDTTVNAAMLAGIVPSATINGVQHYSGGVENFLRLLENWSGDTLTYNGSIIVMFASRYANSFWQQPGHYYNVPTRNWGYDANYSKGQDKLPPIMPSAKTLIRQQWTAN